MKQILYSFAWLLLTFGGIKSLLTTNELGEVIYTGSGYSELPTDIPDSVNIIKLTHNTITWLESFPYFPNLHELNLIGNMLRVFPSLDKNCEEIEILKLGSNQIIFVDASRLDCLVKLTKLDLSNNRLLSFPDVAGPSMTLTHLYLNGNRLKHVPVLTKLGASVTEFYFGLNPISAMDEEALAALPLLQTLDVRMTMLRVFPAVQHNRNLTTLGMILNKIKRIPTDVLNALPRLQSLDMTANGMDSFPDFTNSPSRHTIEDLSLSWNTIKTIPVHLLQNLTALTSLDLNNNPISSLPNLCHVSANFTLYLAPGLTCDCHMAWTKRMEQLGVDLVLTQRKPCVEPAHLATIRWTRLTVMNLTCPVSDRYALPLEITSTYRCSVNDVTTWLHARTLLRCIGYCMQTTGCEYFRFGDPDVTGNYLNCGLADMTSPEVDIHSDPRPETWYALG